MNRARARRSAQAALQREGIHDVIMAIGLFHPRGGSSRLGSGNWVLDDVVGGITLPPRIYLGPGQRGIYGFGGRRIMTLVFVLNPATVRIERRRLIRAAPVLVGEADNGPVTLAASRLPWTYAVDVIASIRTPSTTSVA